jgi:hypothetical protein
MRGLRTDHQTPNELPQRTVEYRLSRFATIANERSPHPLDWKRFYEFVVFAHSRRIGWDAYDVQRMLIGYGFSRKKAEELAVAYWHGRCILDMRKPQTATQSYRRWMRNGGTPWT